MLHAGDFFSDGGANSQLFFEFAAQRIPWLLTLFNFPTRKLPLKRVR
jgi:hypothetical protein